MIDRLGRVIFESDTNGSLSEIKAIVSKIRDHVKRTAKPPTGNQNCQLCTWCTEAHMRGFDVLPRPVYSPRDPVFNIKGESIVKNPIRQSLGSGLRSGIENLLDLTEIEGGRWYCHVNWYSSQGGHEFILMRINKVLYVVDSQQGLVADALSERGGEYFNDIKWGNSYIVRLDDKEFNEEMFMKNNDPSQTLPWNEDLDIPYMKENGMLPDEDINEAKVERINDEGDTVPEKCDKCGSHVGLYLKGEPVWLCSNKKCGKYFGTAPCNFQEATTLRTVDMSKMEKIYYWSPIRLAPDPDQGDIITIEHDSSKLFVTNKIGLCPFYTLYDSEIFENIIKKYNADIVPVLPRNLDELSKEENIVVKLISSEAKPRHGDFTLYVYEVDKSSVSNIVHDKKYKSEYLYAIPRKNGDIIISAKPVKASKVHYTIKPELSNTFQEAATDNRNKMIPVTNFKFNKVYYGDPIKRTNCMTCDDDRPLFTTPYIGLASIFSGRYNLIKILREKGCRRYNLNYDEWGLDLSELKEPLSEVHVRVEGYPDLESFTCTFEGYIHTIDVSNIKHNLYQYPWMTEGREVLIANMKEIPIEKVEKVKVTYIVSGAESRNTFQESTLPDGVFLRPANESDLPNIIKWKLESVNPKTRNDPKTIRFIENDAKENLKDTKMIMSYSTVIGVLESCYIDDGEWWYIGEIYLIPEYRGKGIARVILQQEIDSHDKLKLRVSKDNTHAIDLYKSLGFGISEEDEYAYTMTLVKDNMQELANEKISQQCISYAMGIDSSIMQLKKDGFIINEDDGDYEVRFDSSKSSIWEKYISDHMKNTYWNEYINLDTHVIHFMIKDNGPIKHVINNGFEDNPELLKTCNRLCEGDFKSIKELMLSNDFYKKYISSWDTYIQEGAWNDIRNGVNPWSKKRVFHISRYGHFDGQVFKPRVPEYLDKYDPNYPNFEDVDNPRVCFSPSIEGCLNAIVVKVERWKADRFDKLYVYVPEKSIDQYKHTTNKQIIKDKKVYDANLTREVWIEEPVRLKMYGVIKVDQISDIKKKSTVPMLNGKNGERNYYSYKWHWLIKPKVLDKVPYDYSPTAVCEDMVRDLKRYNYGIPVNGKVQNVPSSEYFDKHYKLLSPDEFDKYGGGICWDYVEFMEGYLDAYGYSCKKYYISTDTKDGDTHTFITVDDGKGGLLYPESSFKLIEGLHKVKNVEEAIKMITSKMFEVNNNSKKYSEIKYYVWEYTGHPEYGSNCVQCTEYFSKGEPFYEGTAINPNKQKIVKESVRMSYPDRFGDNSGLLTRTMERDSDVYMEAKVTPEQAKANREENLRLLQYDSIKRTIVIDGPDGSPIKVKASIGKYDVYGIDPINTMAGKKSIYAASNKNGDAYIRIPPSYLEKDPKYLQPLIAHEAEHVNQINNNKRKHGDMIGGISPRDSESVIKYTRKFIDKHSRQLNNHDKLEAELLADFHAATKFGRKAYSKALRKLTYYGLSLKEFRKARIDTYEDDSPVVKLYRSGETSVDKYIKAAELQIAKFERLKKNCEAIVSLSKDDQGKFDVIGLGGTRVETSVYDQCELTLTRVNILMDSAKAFLERLKSHESDVIDDSIKAECKQINTQIKILSSKIVSLPTLVANITSTELRIKFLKQIMKDKPWLNDSVVSEFFTINGFDDFDVDNFYLEADEDIDDSDDDSVDLNSFGSDNDGSSPNNQYDEEEVSRLNELISDENHAVGQYFEAAKATNNEVLRRLFSDIGSEERFHTEQLLYAKSTITGEKYEPMDKDVKKEYEELLAMGMDEEDAFNTAIDKQHLNDEDDGDDSDMEDLAVDTKAIEESFIYFNDILSLAEIITESDLYESSSELMKSVSFIMETALYMEEVGPADQPKSFLKNNPITVLIKGFFSFIKFINGLVDKIKLFINKIQTKQRRMHDWIKKNGIKALFENGINLYFYNEDDRSVQASAILYADMLTRLVKMIGLEMNINFTPRKKFNVDNNHAVEFNNIDHGLRKFKEVVFSKTKVVVTDNNEAMLAATFFGYNTYKNTEGKSVNIYNVLENVADAVKVISEDTSKFIEHVKNLDRDLNSIYYKDRKKYMLCVEQLKQVYKGLTIMGKALASDMNEILKLNNGLLEKTRAQDKIDMGIDPNNP